MTETPITLPPLAVTVVRGNLYIPHQVCSTYLKNIETVALLPHEEGILLIPLIQQSAGGLLFKTRNLQGDRIVHAQEFFRQHGYVEDFQERLYPVRWESQRAALLIFGVLKTEK